MVLVKILIFSLFVGCFIVKVKFKQEIHLKCMNLRLNYNAEYRKKRIFNAKHLYNPTS